MHNQLTIQRTITFKILTAVFLEQDVRTLHKTHFWPVTILYINIMSKQTETRFHKASAFILYHFPIVRSNLWVGVGRWVLPKYSITTILLQQFTCLQEYNRIQYDGSVLIQCCCSKREYIQTNSTGRCPQPRLSGRYDRSGRGANAVHYITIAHTKFSLL